MDTPVDPELSETRGASSPGSSSAPRRRVLEEGSQLGRYVAQRRLGYGGMGEVWLARDTDLEREVAIKLMRPDKRARQGRMLREAQAMARLRHPNVVAVHDVGTFAGRVFVAMEYVQGETIEQWLETPRSTAEIVDVYSQAAVGLSAAHEAGLVHRDFKPENVMVDATGRAQVVDFGLAREGDFERESGEQSSVDLSRDKPVDALHTLSGSTSLVSQRLTVTGAMVGTPAYMSPEQHGGDGADARSDQFAFGVALYEGLYGERPFPGETLAELATNVVEGRPRPAPAESRVPLRLRRVLLRALARDPEARYPSMADLRDAVRSAVAPRRWPWIAAGVVLLAASGLAVVSAGNAGPCADASAAVSPAWNDEARQATQQAFDDSGVGFAQETLERLDGRLSAYVDELHTQAMETCRDTKVRGVQSEAALDRRLACVRDREQALAAYVRRAAEADAGFVEHALRTAAGLPSIAACAEPSADTLGELQYDGGRRAELQDLRILLDVGRLEETLEAIGPLVEELDDGSDSPELVDALLLRAETRGQSRDEAGAIADAERAMWMAVQRSFERRQIIAGNTLTDLTIATDPQLAPRWIAHAGALLRRRPGMYAKLRAEQHRNRCRLLLYHAEFAEGEACARDLLEGPAGEDPELDFLRLNSQSDLATALQRQGRLTDALVVAEAIVARAMELLGPRHPTVVRHRVELSELLTEMGRHEEAKAEERAALEVLEAGWVESPQRLDHALQALAVQRLRRGQYEEALPFLERAAERAFKVDPLSLDYGEAASTLGVAYWFLGRYPDAESKHRQALDIAEQALGPDHPRVALNLDNLATALERQGKYEEALALHRKALPALEKAFGPMSPTVGVSLRDHARALASAARHEESAELLERSVRIFVAAKADTAETSESRFDLARVLWHDPSARPRAIALAEAARRGYESLGRAEEVEKIDAWQAAVLPEAGKGAGEGSAALVPAAPPTGAPEASVDSPPADPPTRPPPEGLPATPP